MPSPPPSPRDSVEEDGRQSSAACSTWLWLVLTAITRVQNFHIFNDSMYRSSTAESLMS